MHEQGSARPYNIMRADIKLREKYWTSGFERLLSGDGVGKMVSGGLARG